MTTLNRQNTDFFFAACQFVNETGDVSDLMYLLHGASWVSNNEWSAIQTMWDAWEAEYEIGELYGTTPVSNTFLISDITKLPKRPNR